MCHSRALLRLSVIYIAQAQLRCTVYTTHDTLTITFADEMLMLLM